MANNPRWPVRYKAFYDAYYQELLAALVIGRWQRIDLVVNLLVALTTTGSTISGLAYWSSASGKAIWAVLATTASLGAIFHSTARVGSHLQQQGERRREFSHLRGKLQFILFKMTSDGDSEALQAEFEELLAKLVDLTSELEPDIAATLSLREAAQADLKAILTSLGVTTKGIVDETDQVPATAQSAPKLIETVAEVPAAQPAAPTAEVKSDEHPNFTAGSPGAD